MSRCQKSDKEPGLQRWNTYGGIEWLSEHPHTEKSVKKYIYIFAETLIWHIHEKSAIDTKRIHSNTQLEDITQTSFSKEPCSLSLFILSPYSTFCLSSTSAQPHFLSLSRAYLRATYQSQDVVGAISVLLWQDQSFEALLNNSSDDTPWRQPVNVLFRSRSETKRLGDIWGMTQSSGPPHPVWLRACMGSNPHWSIGLGVKLLISRT